MKHLLLDIDGEHAPFRPDLPGDRQRVEAVAATHVADNLAWLDVERLQQRLAILLGLPRVADQPVGAQMAHGLGDFATLVMRQRRRDVFGS